MAKYDSLTDIQKKEFIGQSTGKWVNWSGQVFDVNSNGSVIVDIPGTLASQVSLKGVSQSDAMELSKGQTVQFTGRVTNIMDFMGLHIYLDNVELH